MGAACTWERKGMHSEKRRTGERAREGEREREAERDRKGKGVRERERGSVCV